MRVVLGVAGIRMRMDDLDAVDLVRMVKERRSFMLEFDIRNHFPAKSATSDSPIILRVQSFIPLQI